MQVAGKIGAVMNIEALAKLKKKLTATKKGIELVNGKLTQVEVPAWGPVFANAAANDDWQAALEYAKLTSWKGIAEQIEAALA